MRLLKSAGRRGFDNARFTLTGFLNDFDPEQNLLLFADARGGSTWMAETLMAFPRTALLWEPLLNKYVRAVREVGFVRQQYIPEGASWPEAEDLFDRLLRGKIVNHWTCRSTPTREFRTAERLLIKFCWGKALLPWLSEKYSFKYAPIFLVRHPLAVVSSQLRWSGFQYEFRGVDIPGPPFNEIYQEHAEYLAGLQTKEEGLVAKWALTNLVALEHPDNDRRWITVHYEDLITRPHQEIARIFERWGLAIPPGIVERTRNASEMTKEPTFQDGVDAQLGKWRQVLAPDQQERMLAVLDYFGVRQYGVGILPSTDPVS